MSRISISVIIPTYNEAKGLSTLLSFLQNVEKANHICDIIVSDGQSSDLTRAIAGTFPVKVISGARGRARQLNNGAKHAHGDILYFLHADSLPPTSFISQILATYGKGYQAGCFRLRFDWNHWFLRTNAWFTRFNINALRFGDQSLFIERALFTAIGGYREDYLIMEDQEIIRRIVKHAKFKVMSDYIITSARKYRKKGPYRMQGIYYYLYLVYLSGASQQTLKRFYNQLTTM